MPLKEPIYYSLTDELAWLTMLSNFVEKRKDEILIHWVNERKIKIETKIQKLNEQ